MCAGVQNVSRPIVMCHEMSQYTPTPMLVIANSAATTCHGTAPVRGAEMVAARGTSAAGVPAVTVAPMRLPGCDRAARPSVG